MSYPDKEHTIALLTEWAKHQAAVDRLMFGVEASIGLDPHGPLHETVWALFESYSEAIATEVGDFGGWMAWHHLENDFGKRGHSAGYGNKVKPIKTLAHLYGLIAQSRKREGI